MIKTFWYFCQPNVMEISYIYWENYNFYCYGKSTILEMSVVMDLSLLFEFLPINIVWSCEIMAKESCLERLNGFNGFYFKTL